MEGHKDPIVVSERTGACIVEFALERLLDEMDISRIGEKLALLAGQAEHPQLVLDFANVKHMSSAALGMLITVHKRIRERDGHMALCNIRPEIYEVFLITKLSEVFQIYESRATAMAGLA